MMPPPQYHPLHVIKVQAYTKPRINGRIFSPRYFEVLVPGNHRQGDLTEAWHVLHGADYALVGFLLDVQTERQVL